MLSNPLHDEDRFRGYIDNAIKNGEVEAYDAYTKETQKQRNARQARAKRDGKEAEEYAKKLGKYEKLFGDSASKSNKKISKKDEGPDLVELIQQRQKGRAETFLDNLEAKYAVPKKGTTKSRNGKKRKAEEPPEELFQENRQRKPKVAKAKIYDEDEEEIDLENDSPISQDEDDDDLKTTKLSEDEDDHDLKTTKLSEDEDDHDLKPTKMNRKTVQGTRGRKKGTAQKI